MEQYKNSAIYTLEQVADANALIDAFYKSKRGVSWKASVQKYELNLLKNTYKTRQRLLSGTYKASRFVQFPLSQRGKTRWIKSMHIRDRVVQRAVCDQVLLPKVKPYLIYDNGASLQGKGIDFALNRLEKHLHDHYKHYGDNKGQIVLIDFTKYFDNIPHDILKQRLIDDTEDEGLQKLLEYLFSLFQIDVRYLPDDIREEFIHGVYNSLKYSAYIKQQNPHHVKYNNCEKLKKSIGIGSQISQIAGIYYPTTIDNYFKIVKHIHGYGRYMDDTYIIVRTKEEAKQCLQDMFRLCKELKIHVNPKKSRIQPLSKTFSFLKIKFTLTNTGKVIRKLGQQNIHRNRRRLHKLGARISEGTMTLHQGEQSYMSFRGRLTQFNNQDTLHHVDDDFYRDFVYGLIDYQASLVKSID